jgi:AcrR family transcriptional regulator
MVSTYSPVKGDDRVGTRDQILDAAAHVMRTRGFARATTKEIARAAGYSEATLYKHFQDKTEIFLEVLHTRVPSFRPLIEELAKRSGSGPLRDNLIATARAAIGFYLDSFPMSASIYAEPALLTAHRTSLSRQGAGPHRPVQALAGYLRAEQQSGRIRPDADPDAGAALLLGACLQYAFLTSFAQRPADPAAIEQYATSIVDTLVTGLTAAA